MRLTHRLTFHKQLLGFLVTVSLGQEAAAQNATSEAVHTQSFQPWLDPADPRLKWKSDISTGSRALFSEVKPGMLSWSNSAPSSTLKGYWTWNETKGPWNYQTPPLLSWHASSTREGAIRVELVTASSFYQLKLFEALKRFKEPSKLRLHLELNPKISSTTSSLRVSDNNILPFANIRHSYKEPLYAETCELIRNWVRARQLLETPDQDPSREFDVECVLRWARSPAPAFNQSIVLTTLALPLEFSPLKNSSERVLPFVTAEDALSPSVLQTQLLK